MKKKRFNQVAVGYFVALLLLMWMPVRTGIPLDNFVFGLRLDHLLHASVYLPCAYFAGGLLNVSRRRAWLYSLLLGVLTESMQYLLPYRGFDINDMLANAVGITVGASLCLLPCVARSANFFRK